jgi:hypothetical protein
LISIRNYPIDNPDSAIRKLVVRPAERITGNADYISRYDDARKLLPLLRLVWREIW